MSYYEPEKLPFGVSPFDAQGMGISPWDSQSVATDKLNTELVRQGVESHANFMREMDAAFQTNTATAGVLAGAHGVSNHASSPLSRVIRQLGSGKVADTKHLASLIEEKRSKLERTRLQATRGLKRAAVSAWALAAALFVVVLFHIQFFNASYKQVTYEYAIVRIGLLAALLCGWKFTSMVRRAFSAAEKECILQAEALRRSLGQPRSREWSALSSDPLTPLFIHEFNEHFRKKAGKDIPYRVYRYKELFGRRLSLVPDAADLNAADLEHGEIVALADIREIKLAQA